MEKVGDRRISRMYRSGQPHERAHDQRKARSLPSPNQAERTKVDVVGQTAKWRPPIVSPLLAYERTSRELKWYCFQTHSTRSQALQRAMETFRTSGWLASGPS